MKSLIDNAVVMDGEAIVVPQENDNIVYVDFDATGDTDASAEAAAAKINSGTVVESRPAINKKPLYYRFIKRAFDIVFSLVVIFLTFIPMLILAVFVVIDTKAFPIYTQERIGQHGAFKFFKMRTMVRDSDNVEKYFTPEQLEQWNKEHKVVGDPRITTLGAFLRRTSLDELPQFFNVAAGQMSVIGPRCITKPELEWFGKDADLLLSVPQGVTGAWQIGERNNATFEKGTRQAIELDYCRAASISLDVKIFFATFAAMFINRTGN